MDYYKIGYIANTVGTKGELKVQLLTDNEARFEHVGFCYVDAGYAKVKVYPESCRSYKKGNIALKLKGYDSVNDVMPLKGKYLLVDRDNLAKLEEGRYYIFQVIGCSVYTLKGELLGKVVEVYQPGANDLFVVRGGGKEILIPAVKEMVKTVDIENKVIHVDLPEGLIE